MGNQHQGPTTLNPVSSSQSTSKKLQYMQKSTTSHNRSLKCCVFFNLLLLYYDYRHSIKAELCIAMQFSNPR